jgi:Family of unknown function (DUF6252)
MRHMGLAVRRWIVVLIVTLVGASCGGSNSPTAPSSPAPSGTPTSSLTATIDGVVFVGANVTATYHAGADSSSLLVNAVDAAQNLLSFDIAPPLRIAFTAGTYPLGSNGSNAVYNPFPTVGNTGWNATTGPQSGSVIVTAFSTTTKTASGTFSFVLHNGSLAKTVTNGMFNVTFP